MKHTLFHRLTAFALTLCLCALPTLSLADTWLPDGDVTHADFTLDFKLHADGFPESKAHLSDWETFLNKLDLRGSMDSLAMFTPTSRVYLNAALRLNGKDQIPFVYDGYHSYRYLISPALNNEVLFFQMHNFLEFMLKPYYYMELPTQYIGLLMYPEAAYYIGDSYYAPVAELIANARAAALNDSAEVSADEGNILETEDAPDADSAEEPDADVTETANAAGTADVSVTDTAAAQTPDSANTTDAAATGADSPSAAAQAESGVLTYTVPYEDLYELCENLDLIVNEDEDYERAYFFFTSLLTEMYASDATLSTLSSLEDVLDVLDPEQNGMTVTETPDTFTCALGGEDVFVKKTDGNHTAFTFAIDTPDGYHLAFDYDWNPAGTGAALKAKLSVTLEGDTALLLTAEGAGLPREGDLGGKGSLTFKASGYTFTSEVPPIRFDFNWARDSATLPYTLGLQVDWIHPQTGKPALSVQFNGALSAEDKSVFTEGSYPQNDFFNLNETFLEDYKQRLLPTLALKIAPILLDTPAGVIDDLYQFLQDNNILVSFLE